MIIFQLTSSCNLKMDLYDSNIDKLLNDSSYENFKNASSTDYGNSGTGQQPLPYGIPDCPPGSLLQILYYVPDYIVKSFFYSWSDKLLITKIYPVIFAAGILTNMAFLFTVARIPQMRTIHNFYLVNLACADLILILTKGISSFYSYTWSSDIKRAVPYKSPASCALINSLAYLGYYASICLVTLVSVERFLAICYPLKHRMMNNRGHVLKVACAAWFIAIAFVALSAPNFSKHSYFCIVWPAKWQHRLPLVMNICLYTHEAFINIVSFAQIIPFAVAIILNTLLYFLIIRRLSNRDITKGGEKGDQQKQADKVRNAVTRMLVATGIVFFLCLAPFQFYNSYLLVVRFAEGKQFFDPDKIAVLAYVSRILDLVNSSVNPLIYSATNPRYRQAFLAAFGCGSRALDTKHGNN